MNNNTQSKITEADVLAFFAEIVEKYRPQFPELTDFSVTTALGGKVGLRGYTDAEYNIVAGYGLTFVEAAKSLHGKIVNPADRAKELREKAAKLIAQADAINSVNQ